MSTQRPMPAELAILKPPTRADALAYLQRGWRTIPEWETTVHGKHCAGGRYSQEMCTKYRVAFDEQREAAIADALATLTHEHEGLLSRRAQVETNNAQLLEAEIAGLRERYMRQPGATEAGFEAALPDLLEEARRRAALGGMTERERMTEQMRSRVRL